MPTLDLDEPCPIAAHQMLALALNGPHRANLDADAEVLDLATFSVIAGFVCSQSRAIVTGAGELAATRLDGRQGGGA